MKKIIFICLLVLSFLGVDAKEKAAIQQHGGTLDTLDTSATLYMDLDRIGDSKTITIMPYAINISGTTGITCTLSAYNGLYWIPLTATNCADLTAAMDTVTLVTVVPNIWVIQANAEKYRVKFTASGTTQSSKIGVNYTVK